jgi:hypothetical protein
MLTIEYVKNLAWENAECSYFSCIVKYEQFSDEVPACIYASDNHSHIQEIWSKSIAGDFGSIAEYVPPPEPEVSDGATATPSSGEIPTEVL